jgi:hypothetical protein
MKKLFILLSLLTGCVSIRWVTTDHGRIVDTHNLPVNIVGNPRLTCTNVRGEVVADGYFVRQLDDGAFLIDEFGKRYVVVENPVCRLGSNEKPK